MGETFVLTTGVISAILFLFLSAFFSASETALVSLFPQKAKRLALRRPELSQPLIGWINKPHELLTVILIGNTFATVLFAAIVTALAVYIFHQYSPSVVEGIVWAVETVIIIFLGDMTPKFFARANPEKTSLLVLPWLSRLRRMAVPFFGLVARFRFFFPRSKPSAPVGQMLIFSMQELKALLEEGHSGSEFPAESVNMMRRVLELNARVAEDIMVPVQEIDVIDLTPMGRPAPPRDLVLDLIVENGHTRTPLRKDGRIIGFIHADDLLPLILKDRGKDLSRMVRKAMDIDPRRPVSQLLDDFRTSGIYAGFVRNAEGRVAGLVTLEDVLEEITGEILDEYDVAMPEVES